MDIVTNHWVFDNVIIVFIVISTLTLAFEEPLEDHKSDKMKVIHMLDIIMTVIFTCEAIMKIIALGFLFNKDTCYLRNTWNILDFSIVLFAIFSLVFD